MTQNKLTTALIATVAISVLMIVIRIFITQNITYIFLLWNLFLAWVPMFIAEFLFRRKKFFNSRFKRLLIMPILGLWLLFFPNAPYIVTDLVHLSGKYTERFWYDLFLIYWVAFAGMSVGMLSLYRVHQVVSNFFGKKWGILLVFTSSWLAGFGVYLGRILRWNSWDIFFDPIFMMKQGFLTLTDGTAMIMTFSLGLSLLCIYYVFIGLIHYQPEKITPE